MGFHVSLGECKPVRKVLLQADLQLLQHGLGFRAEGLGEIWSRLGLGWVDPPPSNSDYKL